MIFNKSVQDADRIRCRFLMVGEIVHNTPNGRNSAKLKTIILKLTGKEADYDDDGIWKQISYILTNTILTMIYEKTLSNRIGCTINDIRDFFSTEVLPGRFPDTYDLLTRDEIDWLVNYIVRDTLQNSGRPYKHLVADYENGGFETDYFKILDESREVIDGIEGYYYKTTLDTINYFLHTYEIDINYDFDLYAMRVEEEFKRRNYKDAEQTCAQYLTMIRRMIAELDDLKRRAARDITTIHANDITNEIDRFIELVEESSAGNERIQNAWKVFESDEKITASTEEEYAEIKQSTINIKRLVHSISDATQDLYIAKSEMLRVSNEAVLQRNARTIGSEMLDFDSHILQKLQYMTEFDRIWEIFLPLYSLKDDRQSTPDVFYLPQRTIEYNGDKEFIDYTSEELVAMEMRENIDKEIKNAIFEFIRTRYGVEKGIRYSKVVEDMKASGNEDLLSHLDYYVQSLYLFNTPYGDRGSEFVLRADKARKAERCQFVAEKSGKMIDMENFILRIAEREG